SVFGLQLINQTGNSVGSIDYARHGSKILSARCHNHRSGFFDGPALFRAHARRDPRVSAGGATRSGHGKARSEPRRPVSGSSSLDRTRGAALERLAGVGKPCSDRFSHASRVSIRERGGGGAIRSLPLGTGGRRCGSDGGRAASTASELSL